MKRLLATLKGMTKVDKRCNAYIGLLDECKRWLVFLPMVTALRHPSMRERHWDTIREKSTLLTVPKPPLGIEPRTFGLQDRRSATEL